MAANAHLHDQLRQALQCPVCMKTMRGTVVRLCQNGHAFCNDCRTKIMECPLCRTPQINGRCIVLEDIAKLIQCSPPDEDRSVSEKVKGGSNTSLDRTPVSAILVNREGVGNQPENRAVGTNQEMSSGQVSLNASEHSDFVLPSRSRGASEFNVTRVPPNHSLALYRRLTTIRQNISSLSLALSGAASTRVANQRAIQSVEEQVSSISPRRPARESGDHAAGTMPPRVTTNTNANETRPRRVIMEHGIVVLTRPPSIEDNRRSAALLGTSAGTANDHNMTHRNTDNLRPENSLVNLRRSARLSSRNTSAIASSRDTANGENAVNPLPRRSTIEHNVLVMARPSRIRENGRMSITTPDRSPVLAGGSTVRRSQRLRNALGERSSGAIPRRTMLVREQTSEVAHRQAITSQDATTPAPRGNKLPKQLNGAQERPVMASSTILREDLSARVALRRVNLCGGQMSGTSVGATSRIPRATASVGNDLIFPCASCERSHSVTQSCFQVTKQNTPRMRRRMISSSSDQKEKPPPRRLRFQ